MKIKHGKDYKNEEAVKSKYPVLGTGGIITYIDSFLCNWDCVCIGRKGTINKPIFMDIPFWSVDTLFYTKPNQNENPKFQYYLFQKINWMKYNEASGVPSLSAATIESIKINRPKINEQDKVELFLSLIDRKIALQQQLIENLKLYKRGVNKSIFGNMNKWKQSAIKDIAKVSTGSSNTQDRDENGQYPFFIRSKNVAKSNKYIFDGEAILTIGDGQIGKVFHYYNGKFDCHQRVYMITNFHNINGKYLYHYFSSFFYERAMKMSAKNTVDSVRMEMITEMPIFIPQREVQEKIVYILDKIDGLIKSNQKTQNQLELYKRGLLQQLFI